MKSFRLKKPGYLREYAHSSNGARLYMRDVENLRSDGKPYKNPRVRYAVIREYSQRRHRLVPDKVWVFEDRFEAIDHLAREGRKAMGFGMRLVLK